MDRHIGVPQQTLSDRVTEIEWGKYLKLASGNIFRVTKITAKVKGLKTLGPIPKRGMSFLSINTAAADVGLLWNLAQERGLTPELVQIPYRDSTEVHVLFWHGAIADAPVSVEAVFDELSGQFDNDAVRYANAPTNTPSRG